MNYQKLAQDNMIVKHFAGSIAYGTNTPESDVDYRGIFIAPEKHIITPWFNIEQVKIENEEDTILFELNKFMKLLVDQNPNIVESLWVDEKHIVFNSDTYQMLRLNRHRLLSSNCAFTYSGYALSQLHRLKNHKKWINDPQQSETFKQKDFVSLIRNFSETSKWDIDEWNDDHRLVKFGNDIFGIYPESGYSLFVREGENAGNLNYSNEDYEKYKSVVPKAIIKFNRNVYKVKENHRKQYWKWKRERNEVRAKLEENCGYDSKHAYHLVRLLRTAKEILVDEHVKVLRSDAKELLEIRNGSLTYDELISYSESLDKEIREVHRKNTKLPKTVDLDFAAELVTKLYKLHWSKQNDEK